MAADITGFVPITRQEIANNHQRLNFDLFSVDLDDIDSQPTFLCHKGEEINSVLAAMDNRIMARFYIKSLDLKNHYEEQEASLAALLDNENVP